MPRQSNPPSIKAVSFECPHCGSFTSQQWYTVSARPIEEKAGKLPKIPGREDEAAFRASKDLDAEMLSRFLEIIELCEAGHVGLDGQWSSSSAGYFAWSLHLSKCFDCGRSAVWLKDRLLFPDSKPGEVPNEDLPDDIARDFEEARAIVNSSPRGAAALLRLAVQKLCRELGGAGKGIDDDIASLVGKGLSPVVQQALDVVRVIGNEAVHPGTIDLRDDRDTAMSLLRLVNLITEQMISTPKHVKRAYDALPEPKRKAIEERNARATAGKP